MITANRIGGQASALGNQSFQGINPSTQEAFPEKFTIATQAEVDLAVEAAHLAWKSFKRKNGKEKAAFLRQVAQEIEALGEVLVRRAVAESGLPEGRILGERGRTCTQLRAFADLVEEGSWVDAVIDEALPDRKPFPRADLRKMSVSLGPVAVFSASNFPLAFSTAGGDTASAWAAGCPVIVKGHPSHPGTHALVSQAIELAIAKCDLPPGIFSSLQGGVKVGQQLVAHPLVKAVGFTGSNRGGRAIFDTATQRPEPIPVYAEMGSINPIFLLQEKLKAEAEPIAQTIANSVNLGAGQFCTNPGLLVVEQSAASDAFMQLLRTQFRELQPATMLNPQIYRAFQEKKTTCTKLHGVTLQQETGSPNGDWKGQPAWASVSAATFLQDPRYQEEIFGPFTLMVLCENQDQVLAVAEKLQGQLTATLMATPAELTQSAELLEILTEKVGRVICNGVPTGVEVSPAMHHGGPFPATSNALHTSVGTDAIRRFARPVTFQNVPEALLPQALQAGNPLQIWRRVNGQRSKL